MLGYSSNLIKKERTNWVMQNAVKTSVRPAVSGLSASDLSAFLGFGDFTTPAEDALLQSFIDTAIEMLVKFTGYEPASVDYKIRYDRHPKAIRYTGGISGSGEYAEWLEIPRQSLQSVNSLTISGDVIDASNYEIDDKSNPPRVALKSYDVSFDYPSFAEIEIDITVGPGAEGASNIFITSALMLASYVYNNRGCNIKNAISESGAANMIRPLRVAVGGL